MLVDAHYVVRMRRVWTICCCITLRFTTSGAFIFTIFGVSWVLPGSIKDALAGWKGPPSRKSLKKVWMATPLCLFWTIWRERNGAVFEDRMPSTQRMKNSPLFALWSWETTNSNVQAMNVIYFWTFWSLCRGWSVFSFPYYLAWSLFWRL